MILASLVLTVLGFAATTMAVLASSDVLGRWMARRRQRAEDYQRRLHLARPPSGSVWGGPLLAAVLFLGAALASTWILGAVVGLLALWAVDLGPRSAVTRRARRFDAQLVDALVGLANSLKAGLTLPQAVEQIARSTPAPMSEEMRQVVDEYRLGKTIEQAFEDTRLRVDSRNFDLAVTAFRVGKERGGNLAVVFERIGRSIQEIWRLEENIRTKTTEGRSSARFMTYMPGVFLLLLYVMDPDGMKLLFTDPIGNVVLAIVIVLNLAGHFWIRRILAVEV